MRELVLAFEQEKPTKNTIRYQEVVESEMVVGTLYVQKAACAKLGNPQKLSVVIKAEE